MHVAGVAGADAGHDLGSARDRESDAERHDQGLALETETQESGHRADTGAQPENDQHRQPVGQALDPEQVGERDVGRPDDERDRKVEPAEQNHQGLAQAGQSEESGEHQHRLEIDRREKPVQHQRTDDEQADQHRRADIGALVGRHIPVQRDRHAEQNHQDDRGEDVPGGKEPVDGRGQDQEQGDHQCDADQDRAETVEQVSEKTAFLVGLFLLPVRFFRRRFLPLGAFESDLVPAVDPADGKMVPAPQHERDGRRGEEDDVLQRRFLDHAEDRARPGDQDREHQTQPFVEEVRRAGHRPAPAAPARQRPPSSRLTADSRRPPR